MDRAQLLLQVELALVLEQRPAHIVLDLAFEAEQFRLARGQFRERAEQVHQAGRLEQRLARLMAQGEVRGDAAALPFEAAGRLHQRRDFRRQAAMVRDVFLEQRQRLARLILRAVARRHGERERTRLGAQELGAGDKLRDLSAREPFHQHPRRAVGEAGELQHAPQRPRAEQVRRRRVLHAAIALRHEQHQLVGRLGGLECRQRTGAPYQQRHGDVRKEHHVAQRQHRQAAGGFDYVGVADEALSHLGKI